MSTNFSEFWLAYWDLPVGILGSWARESVFKAIEQGDEGADDGSVGLSCERAGSAALLHGDSCGDVLAFAAHGAAFSLFLFCAEAG